MIGYHVVHHVGNHCACTRRSKFVSCLLGNIPPRLRDSCDAPLKGHLPGGTRAKIGSKLDPSHMANHVFIVKKLLG